MDIVTHAMLGVITAGLFLDRPEVAMGLLFGSVIPDLDTISRVFGKRAFIRWHQSWAHSLPVLAVVSLGLALIPALGLACGLAFFAGAALHVLLDFTNTLGVTLLWPFSTRRMQRSLVFFIDAFVLLVSVAGCAATVLSLVNDGSVSPSIGIATAGVLASYWTGKAALRRSADRMAGPDVVSIIPSALIPWEFLVCRRSGREVLVETLNVRMRQGTPLHRAEICDDDCTEVCALVPEWKLMRALSPAYHAIQIEATAAGRTIRCRDLRTRNFNSRFGDLDIFVGTGGAVQRIQFHV